MRPEFKTEIFQEIDTMKIIHITLWLIGLPLFETAEFPVCQLSLPLSAEAFISILRV